IGGQREIDVAQAQRRDGDEEGDKRREAGAGEERQRKGQGEMIAELAAGVDADAEEGNMREGELPGEAEKHVQADGEHGIHQQEIADIERVDRQRQQRRQDSERGESQEQPAFAHSFLTVARPPNRPCGRAMSTIMMTRNGATAIACAERKSPTRFSMMPSSKPPTITPGMLLKPPMTAAAKARMTMMPISGVIRVL